MNRRRLLIAQSSPSPSPDLPPGYTRLNYLQSTGTQWIDTGVAPATYNGIGIKFNKFIWIEYIDVPFSWNFACGSSSAPFSGDGSVASWGIRDNSGNNYINRFNSSDTSIIDIIMGNEYTVEIGGTSQHAFLKLNGVVAVDTTAGQSVLTSTNYSICRVNQNDLPFYSSIRFGETIVTGAPVGNNTIEGAQILRHFIPALDSNSKPCLYDIVTEQPFYNSGEGNDFLYG